jgi:hypothetical protein
MREAVSHITELALLDILLNGIESLLFGDLQTLYLLAQSFDNVAET